MTATNRGSRDVEPAPHSPVDLNAYLERIEHARRPTCTKDVLDSLHLAHATHIPFENLDILLGRPIRLDLAGLQSKLIHSKRGGYCFEQNTLFAAVLEQIGFRVTKLAARVRFGATRLLPRTHVLLVVEAEGQRWLADVGFGTVGPLLPVPLEPGQVVQQFGWSYRVIDDRDGGLWILQRLLTGIWEDLYVFTFEPQHAVDIEVANWYVSTHPESRFVQALIVQHSTMTARYLLRNYEFTIDRGATTETRALSDDDELLAVLSEHFHLQFPPATRFSFAGG